MQRKTIEEIISGANKLCCGESGVISRYYLLLRRNTNLGIMLIAQMISFCGDWLTFISCLTILENYTNEGTIFLSAYLFTRLFPVLVTGLFSGVVADKYDRRKIMIICDFLRAIVVLSFLCVRSKGTLWILYVASSIQFAISAFFDPSHSAIIPCLVQENQKDMLTANTLDNLVWSSSAAIGSLLGAIITSSIGTNASFIIDSVSFILSAIFLSFLLRVDLSRKVTSEVSETEAELSTDSEMTDFGDKHETVSETQSGNDLETGLSSATIRGIQTTNKVETDLQDNEIIITTDVPVEELCSLPNASCDIIDSTVEIADVVDATTHVIIKHSHWQMFLEGITYFYRNPFVFFLTFIKFSSGLSVGIIDTTNIIFAQQIFPIGENGSITLGLVYLTAGIGTITSPFLIQNYAEKSLFHTKLVLVVSFVSCFVIVLFQSWSPNVYVFLFANLTRTMSSTLHWIYSSYIIQVVVPDEFRGRTFSFDNCNVNVGHLVGIIFAGIAMDYLLFSAYQINFVAACTFGSVLLHFSPFYHSPLFNSICALFWAFIFYYFH